MSESFEKACHVASMLFVLLCAACASPAIRQTDIFEAALEGRDSDARTMSINTAINPVRYEYLGIASDEHLVLKTRDLFAQFDIRTFDCSVSNGLVLRCQWVWLSTELMRNARKPGRLSSESSGAFRYQLRPSYPNPGGPATRPHETQTACEIAVPGFDDCVHHTWFDGHHLGEYLAGRICGSNSAVIGLSSFREPTSEDIESLAVSVSDVRGMDINGNASAIPEFCAVIAQLERANVRLQQD